MSELLTLPAWEIHPGDSLKEGMRVSRVIFTTNEERMDWNTGEIHHINTVTVWSNAARWVCLGIVNDHCIHCDDDTRQHVTYYDATDMVRVIRPAPMEPAPCGFDGTNIP